MVDELNKSVPWLTLSYDEMGDAINMDADALERFVENVAKHDEYEAQVARLSELYREEAEISIRLEAAQEINAQQIAELEEVSREYGEQQAEAAKKTKGMTSRIDDITGKMNIKLCKGVGEHRPSLAYSTN